MLKRTLLLLSTLTTIALPIAMVVSCGEKDNTTPLSILTPASKIESNPVDPMVQTFEVANDSKDINKGVVDVIKNRFNDFVTEGVEAQALKSIHIFDASNSPFDDEGDYVFASNELVINTEIMSAHTNFTDDDKANYIMQLLAHEYNHYVEHNFIMGISKTSPEADLSIHDWNQGGKISPYPKAFLDVFKSDLKYDQDTPLYKDVEVASGKKSIGSKYNQKDLFDYANGDVNPYTNPLDTTGLVFTPVNPIVDTSRVLAKGAIGYLYCMDELFARKMQIITSSYLASTHFDKEGYMILHNGKTESPYLQDIVNYQRGLNDFDNDGLYLQDKPTEDLAQLYDDIRGEEDNSITLAEVKNTKTVKSDGTYSGSIDRSMIRFGGNLVNEDANKFVGYIKDGNFVNVPITTKVDKLHSKTIRTFLTTYIEAKDILGNSLYIADDKDGLNKVAINKTRDTKYGRVTTHRYLDADDDANYEFDNLGILQTL